MPTPEASGPEKIYVADASQVAGLHWAEGQSFFVPKDWADGERHRGNLDTNNRLRLTPDSRSSASREHVEETRRRHAFTTRKPISSRLPVSYQIVPAWMRTKIASITGRRRRAALEKNDVFPGWPLDLSADFLDDLRADASPGRQQRPTPVILSHDIDSKEGLDNLVGQFLDLEERAGARSVNFIVPKKWPLDTGRLDEILARGHQIGVHGYDHSNTTAFCDQAARLRRLDAGLDVLEKYQASGYRAPSLLRTAPLLADLRTRFAYDSSIPTSGGVFPVPQNGCASARPFIIEGVREIPLSMPRDGSLRFLGHSAEEVYQLWVDCARLIQRSGGVVMLLTHCEWHFSGNPEMLGIYQRLLEYLGADSSFVWSSPAALSSSDWE